MAEERNEDKSGDNLGSLRTQAAKVVSHINESDIQNLSQDDIKRMVQELQLYQIELEMQNEQLQAGAEELQQAARKYEDLYHFAPVGYVTLSDDGLVQEANLTATQLFGRDRLQLLHRPLAASLKGEAITRFYLHLRQVFAAETRQVCELPFSRPDGTVFQARLESILMVNPVTEEKSCRTAIIDITAEVEATQKLQQSEELVRKITDVVPDILTIYDLNEARNIYANREVLHCLGISPEALQALTYPQICSLIHPEDLKSFQRNMDLSTRLKDEENLEYEYRIRNAQNDWTWLRVRTLVFQRRPDGAAQQLLNVKQDITFKMEAEAELRSRNHIINSLLANLPVIVSRIQTDGTIDAALGSGLQPLQVKNNTLAGQNIYKLFPEKREKIDRGLAGDIVGFEYVLERNNVVRHFQNYIFPEPFRDTAISFSIDISEQKEAERRIRLEQEFSQSLLDNSIDGIVALDAELRITAWNRVMEESTGFKRSQVLGNNIFDLFPGFKTTEAARALLEVLKGQKDALYGKYLRGLNRLYDTYLNPLIMENG
ncbi:MAG TPA: PAS domain S-box protein, partial [Anseongella sp.]|nr:PAS domain S-box protein [Anseongella sp.]